jgi:hypothetical protein
MRDADHRSVGDIADKSAPTSESHRIDGRYGDRTLRTIDL